MPVRIKTLSDLEVRRLTCKLSRDGMPKLTKYPVGGVAGLCLLCKPSTAPDGDIGRSWILRATINGRQTQRGLGGYPEVSLSNARDKAREYRKNLSEGIDPIAERKRKKLEQAAIRARQITFAQVAAEYLSKKSQEYKTPKQTQKLKGILSNYVLPHLGALLISDIDHEHIVAILNPIWLTKTETANRARIHTEGILSLAEIKGLRQGKNPAQWAGNLKLLFPAASKVAQVEHLESVPYALMPEYLVALKKKETTTAKALEFLIYTASRPAEVRGLKWSEIDLDGAQWALGSKRAKNNRAKVIPLSDAVTKLLESLPRLSELVFDNGRGKPLSDSILPRIANQVAQEAGLGKATAHGFRSSFRTWAQEQTGTKYRDEVIELALGHVNSDATRAAYARSDLIDIRRELMSDWSNFLGSIYE